jgi:hypothetical protein
MAGEMDRVNEFFNRNLYIACLDENLNKLGEIYHVDDYVYMIASLSACPEGGCLLSCHKTHEATNESENCLIKITKETFVGIEEAHDAGFAVAVAYPNPGKDVLNVRTALQNARVEVYDMNGRLVHSQDLTENVTAIDANDWAEGVYVWKVVADGKEVEIGKWVKE